ncbi:hypothetical protein RJ641_021106 [Dillenia turbinata]|uniref:Flowering-promoting factor 1-like protein 3 n=1 Tax=Dillenia turbinata TaxID=194707 RepID=A0AAN8YVC9_9MAGN
MSPSEDHTAREQREARSSKSETMVLVKGENVCPKALHQVYSPLLLLVENPGAESMDGSRQASGARRKVLVHVASNEVITSYAVLERKLTSLGWERYYDDPDLLQFHKRSTVHLISLPRDFNKFRSMHMYDIVVKNRNEFEVRDM